MPLTAEMVAPGNQRPLQLRYKPGLVVRRHEYLGEPHWVIKDPLAMKYVYLREPEYAVLNLLDGHHTLGQIKQQIESEFAPISFSLSELQHFIGSMHRSGLVVSDAAEQGVQLAKRGRASKRRETLEKLANVLSWRCRGVDPDRFLTWLYRGTSWIFTRPAIIAALLLQVCALLLVIMQFETFTARLPEFHQFFGANNWLLLAATLAGTKVLHELGHGLTCKHYGGECHELGVMLLIFTPCLYCDVTDSWLLRSKWKRASIAAAGIFVELFLAAVATLIWCYAQPSVVSSLCLNVMFVCSVSTLLFNGNPLLKFDAYFVLSHLSEVPNLQQKSSSVLRGLLGRHCLGFDFPPDQMPTRRRVLLALYAIAAATYRWIVVFGILWFMSKVFEPYGLKIIGQLLAAIGILGLIIIPGVQLVKFLNVPGRIGEIKRRRFSLSLGIVLLIVAGVLFIPLPHRIVCDVEIRPQAAETVYVESPGRLKQLRVKPLDSVKAGDLLGELENLDLELSLANLEGQKNHLQKQLNTLLREIGPTARVEARQVEQSLESVQSQLIEVRRQHDRLNLIAPITGTVLPVERAEAASPDELSLPNASVPKLDQRSLGAHWPVGEVFCLIGDPASLEAVIQVEQRSVEYVRTGQRVWLKLDGYPSEIWETTVEEISASHVRDPKLTDHHQHSAQATSSNPQTGTVAPAVKVVFQARGPLDNSSHQLRLGMQGRAKIDVGWSSLGARFWRYLSDLFHFHL